MNPLKNKKVLIVDDEEMIRDVLSLLFKSEETFVETATDGLNAMDKINENSYDIIVSDIRMPSCNGIAFLKMLPDDVKNKAKIFICTGFNDITDEEAKNLGAIKIFPKPFEFSEVSREIQSYIN